MKKALALILTFAMLLSAAAIGVSAARVVSEVPGVYDTAWFAVGETYNIGAGNERTNLQVVRAVCAELDALAPLPGGRPHESLVEFVADRPGHDFRYAVDSSKLRRELGWRPRESFDSGLRKTVGWYLANPEWLASVCGR